MTTTEPLLDPEFLRQLERLDLIAETLSDALKHGLRRSRRHGFSVEFSDYKPYAAGDDLRFLDWRIYARTNRLLTRKYEAETSFESLLLLDASRSMAWRWQETISKLEYATHLFAAISYVHIDKQDLIGLLVRDSEQSHFVPPRSGRRQLERIYATLGSVVPGPVEAFPSLVEELASIRKHRGQIVVCSDLEEDEERVAGALESLAARDDDVVVIHLLDRAEIELPFTGATHFRDSETGELLPVDLRALRKEQRRRVEEIWSTWRTRCEASGIRYHPVHTGMSYLDVLLELAESSKPS